MPSTITSNTLFIYLRQTSSTSLIEYSFNNSSWSSISTNDWEVTLTTSVTPTLANPLVVTLTTDLTISSTTVGGDGTSGYFIIGNDYTTIEGNYSGINHKVTIDTVTNYPGLIQNGTGSGGSVFNGKNNVTLQNLGVEVNTTGTASTLANNGGWIGQSYFGRNASNNVANNCYSTGVISGESSGGIFGVGAGYLGNVSANNCYSTGGISGLYSGGIFGSNAGSDSGNASATNCYSTGAISGTYSGGIFGEGASSNNATNCYSTGEISGTESGGIFGRYAGSLGNASANNCYSTGDISGLSSGGIFGSEAGYSSGNVSATNCYSSGVISSGADGIGFPDNSATTYNLLNVYVANGNWHDSLAQGILSWFPASSPGSNFVWTSCGTDTPYLLTAFNTNNYSPSFVYDSTLTTGNYTTSAGIFTTEYTYELLSVIGTSSMAPPSIATNGAVTFNGITTTGNEQYDATVISYKTDTNGNKFSYHISHFYINPANPLIFDFNPTTGNTNGGTTVTIFGQNLIDVSRVRFGTADATSFTINSANKITAISPSGSGTVSITITSTNVSPISVNNFTYSASTDQSPLTITSLNGTNGTGLTLTTVGGSGTGAVTYQIIGGGTASNASITSGILTTTSIGTVFVQATKAGNGTYSAITSPVTTITFRDNQTVSLAITPTSGTSPLTLSNPSPGTQLTVQNASYYSIYPYGTTATGTSMTSFGTLSSSENGTLSATSSGNVIVFATNSGNETYNSLRTSATINLTANSVSSIPPIYLLPPVPMILIQPESQTAELGQDIQLFVVAEDGYTLTDKNIAKYQWYKNTVPYTPVDVPIPDSNSPVLILENIRADDEGDYYVVITNKLGGITISHIAQITVVVQNLLMIDQNTIDNENIEEPNILDILDNINNSL